MSAFTSTTAVVTGASSGIGRAIAVRLATLGAARVLIHYCSNVAGARETAQEIETLGCQADILGVDLADHDRLPEFVDSCFERLGRVDAWINNAGADVLTGDAASDSFEKKLRTLIEVDLVGTTHLARSAASRMRDQKSAPPPSMTFIGWDQSPRGMEGDAGQLFAPVKAALMALANSLAQEYAPDVRVNTVAPGWIQTDWGAGADEVWDARARGQSLMNRWGHVNDVALAVAHLSDPANTFATAQTIEVNGGWNRRWNHGDS